MMRTIRGIVFCLLVMVAFAPRALSDVSAEERNNTFAWFDSLGYTDVTKLPLVKITDDTELRDPLFIELARYSAPCPYGFLMHRDEKQFAVYNLGLYPQNLTFAPATKDLKGTFFAPIDLKTYVTSVIKWQANIAQAPDDVRIGSVGLFVLARVCVAHGLTTQSAQLCNIVARGMALYGSNGRSLATFRDQISDALETTTRKRLWREFGDLHVSRAELLSAYDLSLKRFPNCADRESIIEIENNLKRLVLEDLEHARRPALPPGAVSRQQQIEELVYALRDQNGSRISNPGHCDVFQDPRGEKSPASQLVKIGLPTVPALLDALADDRLTRSTGNFHFSGPILRVGDAAQQILERIANREFNYGADSKPSVPWLTYELVVQSEARQWWAEIQAKGERQVLIEGVRRGDSNAVRQAYRLVELDPNLALPAMTEAINQTKDGWVRQTLVSLVGDLHRNTDLPLLKSQLHAGKDLGTRLKAAEALRKQGDTEAVTCMIQEWERHPERNLSADDFEPFLLGELIRFLVNSGSPDAMQALDAGMKDRSADLRYSVVDALYDGSDYDGHSWRPAKPAAVLSTAQQACSEEAQRLLIGRLHDTDIGYFSASMGRHSGDDPRICDFADAALAELWPQTYRFHDSGSLFERDYERIANENRWRSAHGLPALPYPVRHPVSPASASLVQPLLTQFAHADTILDRQRISDRIFAIGLPALSAVHKAEQADANRPLGKEWLALARRLSLLVRAVHIDKSIPPDAEIVRQAASLEGHPLTTQAFDRLFSNVMKSLSRNAGGVRLSARRENDGTGFTVEFALLPPRTPNNRSNPFATYERVEVGTVRSGLHGGTSADYHVDQWSLYDFRIKMDKALAAGPYEPIFLEIEYQYEPDKK